MSDKLEGVDFVSTKTKTGMGIRKPIPLNERKLIIENATDLLTGLKNKQALEAEWNRAQSLLKRGELDFKFMFIDLDKFKPINDIDKSHKFGDKVLKIVAKSLNSIVRPEDVVARPGGDEFAVILSGSHSTEDSNSIQTIFENRFKEKFQEIAGVELLNQFPQLKDLGMSVGVATPETEDTFDTIYQRADGLMYQRKESKGIAR